MGRRQTFAPVRREDEGEQQAEGGEDGGNDLVWLCEADLREEAGERGRKGGREGGRKEKGREGERG